MLGLIYTLRSLFPVIFITFVVSYICRNVVRFLNAPFGNRWYMRKVIVIITFLLLLSGFYLGGRFLVPNIYEQGKQIVNIVRDLRLHEDVDSALPNLYASLRFWFYKNSDAYKEELEEFKEGKDPGQVAFDNSKETSKKLRDQFEGRMVRQLGELAYEENKETPEFLDEFNAGLDGWVEHEFEQDREHLLAEKEQDLRRDLSDGMFDRVKKLHGSTEVQWNKYLKDQALLDLYRKYDGNEGKEAEYNAYFKEAYVIREGEAAIMAEKGTGEWELKFKAFYEGPPAKEFPYDRFVQLEQARTRQGYLNILGEEANPETMMVRFFREKTENKFAETFREYGFVEELNTKMKGDFLPDVAKWVASTIEYTFTLAFQMILSVFLSFFIVWDIPRLKKIIGRLGTSRMSNFYREVYPGLVSFGWLMGRAFQAQAIIAAVNTMLTLSAMHILDVPHKTFLCSIVFICSFIPVVGVIISSVPIVVVSLQEANGFIIALEMVGCVLLIHFLETTVLNPKIMGDMLKLHPLLVLIILLVGEHFFGVWGLLLGVPISVYIFRFVILRDIDGLVPPEIHEMIDSVTPESESAGKA